MIQRERERVGAEPNDYNVWDCKIIEDAKKNKDLICMPIYKWNTSDVWEFIRNRCISYNPLYDQGFTRVGCVGCPLAVDQVRLLERYPSYKENYIRAFDRMVDRRRQVGKHKDSLYSQIWKDGESVYKWWIGDTTIDGQMTIDDFLEEGEEGQE